MNKQATRKRTPVWLLPLIAIGWMLFITFGVKDGIVNLSSAVNKVYVTCAKPVIHSAVPPSLWSNVYLAQKECGCCKTLTGDVAISVILVSDDAGQWDEETAANLKTTLETGKTNVLEDAASCEAELSLTFYYYNADLTGEICNTGKKDNWRESALKRAGLPAVSRLHKKLTKQYDAKEAPVIFAFNKPGRAYARRGMGEYFVMFSDSDAFTFQHELSHIFGAADFYYPKEVKNLAATHLTDTIMITGESVDALTAYLIGWKDTVDDNALEFLKNTKHLSAAYLRRENKKETFTGTGTREFETGTYTGELQRGVCHGTGTMQYDNGGWYTGQWENNQWAGNGVGKNIHQDGSFYEGSFLNGKRHGQGSYTFTDGSVYTGQWEEGEMSGTGTIQYASGAVYTGELRKGKLSGTGTLRYADGGWYTGQWEDDEYTGIGEGKLYYSNGSYEGAFLNGKRHGQGTYTWTSGAQYTGQWTEGKRTGYGTYTNSDGTVKTGMFEDGKFLG